MVTTIKQAVDLVREVCLLPGNNDFLKEIEQGAKEAGILRAIEDHDTPTLYDWLMNGFSFQGISDRIALDYIDRHGNSTWQAIETAIIHHRCACPKLDGFHAYSNCGYRKTARTCRNPTDLSDCPVPELPLRKGDLNQLAFSLYFFLRDRCQGDLAGFIDGLFAEIDTAGLTDPITAKRDRLMAEFSAVHAVSTKLIAMMISDLLIAGRSQRRGWEQVGRSMVVVDSLVHNFLHRTDILAAFDCSHQYGPTCHRSRGCGPVIRQLAERIDTREINRAFPRTFPRFVEFAIWAFCAEDRADICNGRRIDDGLPCTRTDCPVGDQCSRIALRPSDQKTPSTADIADPEFRGWSQSRQRRKQRAPLRPLRQGHLDGLCGVYAIINGIRHALGPDGQLDDDVWDQLFVELLSGLDQTAGTGAVLTNGIKPRRLRKLAKAATNYLADHHDMELTVSRPYQRSKKRGLKKLLAYIKAASEQPGTAVVIGIAGKTDHWSVVGSVGSQFITLFDSSGHDRLRLDHCQAYRERKARKQAASYVLDPRWLVQLTAA